MLLGTSQTAWPFLSKSHSLIRCGFSAGFGATGSTTFDESACSTSMVTLLQMSPGCCVFPDRMRILKTIWYSISWIEMPNTIDCKRDYT